MLNYSAPIYVKLRLINKVNQEKLKDQEVFFGADFPLMTDMGTFVITELNVIVSQLVQFTRLVYFNR